ncbi:uncharacterized protein LACBIDRAFT_323952 [Laccaria bicolor S238N-H82]|uniref:Predicted protein n=1 Tax=Laccaria bicolor (strain S238N-H82 / ATCC MYA-4686) TaxID=486041 RepID=B0D057_LACBS|nr:uncharacterized protein LACBIDRAFT_323952 [Laccaria bicolor S238N-H82]EDR11397.1 predicted protein [Laccaria bicolor S238N-H82]|eukprot:XP_001877294.1 predicted protein [Laccaria bicolor S238N-H82]
MFVQGFWFGSKLVRGNKISAGDVMAVFWACLIATSNMQMCFPQFIILAKGKFSTVSLISLATSTPQSRNLRVLKKITPPRCSGELALHNVTFAYPSRPTIPVLSNIGHITIDEQDVRFLDDGRMKAHVAGVSQSGVVILDGKSVFENLAAGVFGRRVHAVAKEEVEDVCGAALMHECVRDLLNGYDTLLGGDAAGVGLSDEATSALDATSRTLVFEAIKRWRKRLRRGITSALIYLAEAVVFYVGAIIIARGTYTYLQMVEVLNLVVFPVTIGSLLMPFTEKVARSGQAASDFNRLLQLDITSTDESKGVVRPELAGRINFNNVHFFYAGRPAVLVLRNINLSIDDGECIAIVGPSGSGKSTLAALLQRLYEPTIGAITIGLNRLCNIEVNHLRDHVSVVSQHPNLFDATTAENIRYGNQAISDYDIRRAAKAAQVGVGRGVVIVRSLLD